MTNPLIPSASTFSFLLELLHEHTLDTYLPPAHPARSTPSGSRKSISDPLPPLPTKNTIESAKSKIIHTIDGAGIGLESAIEHLVEDIVPALGRSSLSPRYYGFVTGGTTPAALLADHLVTLTDTNVQVHLPNESLNTTLEHHTLSLLQQHLFRIPPSLFPGKIFTTGATSANILGLACGREHVFSFPSSLGMDKNISVGEIGLLEASRRSGIEGIDILCALPHASIYKAAGVLGLGRESVKDIGKKEEGFPWEIDMLLLEKYLSGGRVAGGKEEEEEEEKSKRGAIVCLSWGEVNTGKFTSGIRKVRRLVDKYADQTRAWIHVDGAFGVFARMFWTEEDGHGEVEREEVDERLRQLGRDVDGLECADSVTADGHKMLNVPYDCGIFFTKSTKILTSVLSSPAPYLNPTSSTSEDASSPAITSPLILGLENSRRFRALPVYATLIAYGTHGYQHLITTLILHARSIATYILNHSSYELLPANLFTSLSDVDKHVFTIVLFRAKNGALNRILKDKINSGVKGDHDSSGGMYVSGTIWDGKPAVRIAVCNWRVEVGEDGAGGWGRVKDVLHGVAKEWEEEQMA